LKTKQKIRERGSVVTNTLGSKGYCENPLFRLEILTHVQWMNCSLLEWWEWIGSDRSHITWISNQLGKDARVNQFRVSEINNHLRKLQRNKIDVQGSGKGKHARAAVKW